MVLSTRAFLSPDDDPFESLKKLEMKKKLEKEKAKEQKAKEQKEVRNKSAKKTEEDKEKDKEAKTKGLQNQVCRVQRHPRLSTSYLCPLM